MTTRYKQPKPASLRTKCRLCYEETVSIFFDSLKIAFCLGDWRRFDMGDGVQHLRHVRLNVDVVGPQAVDREVGAALCRFAAAGTRLVSLRLCRYLDGPFYPIDRDEQCVAVYMCSALDWSEARKRPLQSEKEQLQSDKQSLKENSRGSME